MIIFKIEFKVREITNIFWIYLRFKQLFQLLNFILILYT